MASDETACLTTPIDCDLVDVTETLPHSFFDCMLLAFWRDFWIQPMISTGVPSTSLDF